jgi:hypothetical protein
VIRGDSACEDMALSNFFTAALAHTTPQKSKPNVTFIHHSCQTSESGARDEEESIQGVDLEDESRRLATRQRDELLEIYNFHSQMIFNE